MRRYLVDNPLCIKTRRILYNSIKSYTADNVKSIGLAHKSVNVFTEWLVEWNFEFVGYEHRRISKAKPNVNLQIALWLKIWLFLRPNLPKEASIRPA